MEPSCVFCAIVGGKAPAERVFEDDAVIAIMDVHPATEGHILVLPKQHARDIWDIDEAAAESCMAASVRVAQMIRDALHPAGINLVHATGAAAWQTVFHFHIHLVPRYEGDGLVQPWTFRKSAADRSTLKETAERIRDDSR